MVHDVARHALYILDATLNRILVLAVGLRLTVLDVVETEDVAHRIASLRLGVVADKSLHGTMVTDEVFKC